MNAKKKINYNEAEKMLNNKLKSLEIGDEVYSMVHEIFSRFVEEIEDKYTVVDDDGEEFGDDDAMWYDDLVREGFFEDCYAKIKAFL